MSQVPAVTLPLPVLLALAAMLLVSVLVAVVAATLHRPAPVPLAPPAGDHSASAERA